VLGAALAALVSIGGGQVLASAGCDAVNAGVFDVTLTTVPGQITSNPVTISNFAVGGTVTFQAPPTGTIPNFPTGGNFSWQLASGNNTTLDQTTTPSTRTYTVTGFNSDTTLKSTVSGDQVAGTITMGASCVAAPAPTVTNVNPNSGPTTGGTVVAITGTGFS